MPLVFGKLAIGQIGSSMCFFFTNTVFKVWLYFVMNTAVLTLTPVYYLIKSSKPLSISSIPRCPVRRVGLVGVLQLSDFTQGKYLLYLKKDCAHIFIFPWKISNHERMIL